MLRTFILALFLASSSIFALAQEHKHYEMAAIGFYNLENLFDTLDSPDTDDKDFTPAGEYRYNTKVYWDKMNNLSDVISQMGEQAPDGIAILGVAEIENRSVLEELVKMPKIKDKKYQIVHFNSPDKRGIDVGLLYNPKYFKVESAKSLLVGGMNAEGTDTLFTRDILLVSGKFRGENMHVMVGHWPSRRGGEKATDPLRRRAAGVCKTAADSIIATDPNAKIFIMGDLNDDPISPSVAEVIGAKGKETEVIEAGKGFFNPWMAFYKKGYGTLGYNDAWNLFDQIMLSYGILNKKQTGFHYYKAEVFRRSFLLNQTGKYKGYPWRTYAGTEYIGGYSDHLPVFLYIKKEKK